jgi:hypothetical protein
MRSHFLFSNNVFDKLPIDLQAGHSKETGHGHYGKLTNSVNNVGALAEQDFFNVSVLWQWLLKKSLDIPLPIEYQLKSFILCSPNMRFQATGTDNIVKVNSTNVINSKTKKKKKKKKINVLINKKN